MATTPRTLRLTEAAARMTAALDNAPNTPQAADLRAELADPHWVSMGTVAQISGLSGIPAHKFFERNDTA